MRPRCCFCNRPTEPFLMIGDRAVGPKCARRAGLLPDKMPKSTGIRFLKITYKTKSSQNLDLFEDLQEIEP